MSDAADLELSEGQSLVADADELALRQIVEWMVSDGTILTHVFGPSTSDHGKPSYTREKFVGAQEARDWHEANGSSKPVGVWAVSVDEVHGAGTHVIDDSSEPGTSPGHCFVDFRGLPKHEVKSIRYTLWQRAMERGEIPTERPLKDGELFGDD